MKKIFFIIAACFIGITSVKAQIAKGNLFVGTGIGSTTYNFGNYSYTYSDANVKNQDQKAYTLNLSPSIGVFLTDHLIFGGSLNLAYDHNKTDISNTTDNFLTNNSTVNTTTFTAGPFVRYYFFDAEPKNTLVFVQADAAVGTGGGSTNGSTLYTNNSATSSNGNTNGMFVFKAGGAIGVTHFIQKNIGLDISVGYGYDLQKYTATLNTQTTNAAGLVSNTSSSYKASIPQNGITLAAGFHFFIK